MFIEFITFLLFQKISMATRNSKNFLYEGNSFDSFELYFFDSSYMLYCKAYTYKWKALLIILCFFYIQPFVGTIQWRKSLKEISTYAATYYIIASFNDTG